MLLEYFASSKYSILLDWVSITYLRKLDVSIDKKRALQQIRLTSAAGARCTRFPWRRAHTHAPHALAHAHDTHKSKPHEMATGATIEHSSVHSPTPESST